MFEGFTLRRIEPDDNCKAIKAGDEAFNGLKTFAQRQAKRYEDEALARTYVLYDDTHNCIAAYMTMVCSEVTSEKEAPLIEEVTYPYLQWPSVKISRLLVDARYRREGARWAQSNRMGEGLVQLAIGIALESVCPAVGCRFMVVDAHRRAIGFYKKLGFSILNTPANLERAEPIMFMDMHKARETTAESNVSNDINSDKQEAA